jgi:hypothetical protein
MVTPARARFRGLLLLLLLTRHRFAGGLTLASVIIGSLGMSLLVGSVVALVIGRPPGFPLGVVLALLLGLVALAVGWRLWRTASWRPYRS